MKEFPQEECTNCNKESGSWCVCKQCRNNAKIVKKIKNKIEKLKKRSNTGKWYLKEWESVLGKRK